MENQQQHPQGNSRGNQINGRANKDRRRKEAYTRLDAFNKLSILEKLRTLPKEGAKRQRTRYEAILAKQKSVEKQVKKEERTQQSAEKLVKQQRKSQKIET